ncbi:MAG TPA: cysteine dioxygenase family protein [Acidimicrobiales bacterium]|nr:cysteine dioxygenase family protein [Acidimicrobiales bacterium]
MTTAGDPVIRLATGRALTVAGLATTASRRRDAVRRPSGPAVPPGDWPGLSPIALLDLARGMAGQVPRWADGHTEPLVERRYELLELTNDVEVWVIHWPTGGHLQVHDHGGSAGAFWVVDGALEERYAAEDRSLRRRHIGTANGAAFGPRYVHDVRNDGDRPATSVHAYSPPMPGMTFYRSGPGGLVAERTEYRSDPSWAP